MKKYCGNEVRESVRRKNSILASPIIKSGWLSKKGIQKLKKLELDCRVS